MYILRTKMYGNQLSYTISYENETYVRLVDYYRTPYYIAIETAHVKNHSIEELEIHFHQAIREKKLKRICKS